MAIITTPTRALTLLSVNARTYPTATDPNRLHLLRSAALELKGRGYKLGEHFDPALSAPGVVVGAHSTSGLHYVGVWCRDHGCYHSAAIDVNVGPAGTSVLERAHLDTAAKYLMGRGLRVVWGSGVEGHTTHLHVDTSPATRSEVRYFATPTPTLPPVRWPTLLFHRPLRRGHVGRDVALFQTLLAGSVSRYWRAYLGTPDGEYGPRTERVCRAFQKAAHLDSDGVAGVITLTAAATKR